MAASDFMPGFIIGQTYSYINGLSPGNIQGMLLLTLMGNIPQLTLTFPF